ncbi:MAG: LPS export ABC transporter periplasmic protein LptC [Pseudomonadota bacterium]
MGRFNGELASLKKRVSIPLLLCVAGVIYALLAEPPSIVRPSEPVVSLQSAPDSYAEELRLTTFDSSGNRRDETEAQTMHRYAASERTELSEVIRRGHGGDTGWVASAERGVYFERDNVMRLESGVRISYTEQATQAQDGEGKLVGDGQKQEIRSVLAQQDSVAEKTTAETEAMLLNLNQETARSLAPAIVQRGTDQVSGDALFVNMRKQVATLTGSVRSHYEPAE